MPTPQVVPTGVSRIGANSTTATGLNVKVAVIDTGIDPCHPDLNVEDGVSFVETETDYKDYHGHGTHVAGIIGAKDNGFGVVGVAPAVTLYAVKVLDKTGSGSFANVIAGIDWAAANNMHVANLSLGALGDFLCVVFGLCGIGPECTAVANAVNAGVTVVVAAGNAADETLYYTPAHCPYSLTVTALADSDGIPGFSGSILRMGRGTKEYDDTFAETFSNWSDYCWDRNGNMVCDNKDSLK
jgi:subtilisin family serine protease